ncbi:MAG: IS5 family transposase [bacterium]|nr:IS5 family transposase [bacterium]
MSSKRSKVHPKYKTKYRAKNWAAYDRALVARGDITLWITPEAIAAWRPAPTGGRGAQPKFSDLAIETALTLRLVFHLPLRQAEGFLRSVLRFMGLELESPDHTTLSRRGQGLALDLRAVPHQGPVHLLIDSSGLAAFGEGEWAAAKHGVKGRRGWRKLHLSVDARGMILAQCLTDATADDATTGVDLLSEVKETITSVTADGAYDTTAFYEAAGERGARVVVPPSTTATSSRKPRARASPRNRTIQRVQEIGRRAWKKEAGYHQQARAENAFFRYKTIIGDRLRARSDDGRRVETRIACDVLNRMTRLGRPESVAIGA